MSTAPNVNDPLGFDVYLGGADGLSLDGRAATGRELVIQSLIDLLENDVIFCVDAEPNGVLDFGIVVMRWIGEALTDETVKQKGPLVASVFQRDPRVETADVEATLVKSATWAISLRCNVGLVSGEALSFTIGIDQVTVALLAEGGK